MTTDKPDTWIDPEEYAYTPRGSMIRKGRARVVENLHNPIDLPYGEIRRVRAGIPDTFFTIPARLRVRNRTIKGYLSLDDEVLTFTPEADPDRCVCCVSGEGCKQD